MYQRKVFLYAFDRTARVVNYRYLVGEDVNIGRIRAMARQLYLLAGKEPIVVFAIDDYPKLHQDYLDSVNSNDPANQIAFFDLLDKQGLYIHN